MRNAPNMALPNWGRSYPDRSLDGLFRFRSLPLTEASADANVFVCEFTGGASANETGVGGGLTGSDLVLSQINGVGASVGGYRPITKDTIQGFGVTAGLINNFARSAAGFSALWLMKDYDMGVLTNPNRFFEVIPNAGGITFSGLFSYPGQGGWITTNVSNSASKSLGGTCGSADFSSHLPTNGPISIFTSVDYATSTFAYGVANMDGQPLSFGACKISTVSSSGIAFAIPDAMSTFSNSCDAIVGIHRGTSYVAGMKIKSLSFAKYPCVVPV
ncbi:MAG: hypothetical protein CVU73_11150 [Deltaproteobacteria bacterium HGW-Deltaproteobacteria-8]|jgi:hypothetical protein|nr:MAG: hypothetical protein CVU73_11150 [Deltaproteobacteria bacterium HGW-Deltaproteobacteria-8]